MFQYILNCFKNKSSKAVLNGYEKDVLSSVMDVIPAYQVKKGESQESRKQFNQSENPRESNHDISEKGDEDNNPYCKLSLDYFSVHNRIRWICIRINESHTFKYANSLLTFVCVVVLFLKSYNNVQSGINFNISDSTVDGVIIASDVLFTAQVLVSIISYGQLFYRSSVWNAKFAYYKDPFNIINSVCLFFAVIIRQSYLYTFRTLYLVDYVISTKYFSIAKKLSMTVKHALMMIVYVLLIVTLFISIYAAMGVQIWSGLLNQYCISDGKVDQYPVRLCGIGRSCNEGYTCQTGTFHQPFTQFNEISFDEMQNALNTLFVVHFIEGWVEVEQLLADSFNKFVSSIYLWSYIMIGTFFLQNLLVAILLNQYQMDFHLEEPPQLWLNSQTKISVNQERRKSFYVAPGHMNKSKQRVLQLLTNLQQREVHRSRTRMRLKQIISSKYTKYFYSLLFLGNLILFSFNDERAYNNNLQSQIGIANLLFLILYLFEDCARIYVWKQKENKYVLIIEFIIDFVSAIVQLTDLEQPFVGNALKGLRLLWFFNTQTNWSNYKVLLSALQKSFVHIPKLLLVFATYMFIIGIIGRECFAGKLHFDKNGSYNPNETYVPRANFDGIRETLTSLFIIICSDQWQVLFYSTLATGSWVPYPFFISVQILCRFFILPSFLTLMLDNYEEAKNEADKSRARAVRVITSMQKTSRVTPIQQQQQQSITPQMERKKYFGRLSKMSDDSDNDEQDSKQILQRQTSKLPVISVFRSDDHTIVQSSLVQTFNWKQYLLNSSLFILHNRSTLRKRLQYITQSKQFEWLMSSIIILNLILLGVDLPLSTPVQWIINVNKAFAIIFIFEIMLRVLAHGFVYNRIEPSRAFVFTNQNLLDLGVLILSGINDLGLYESGYLKAFRALRTIRVFTSARRGSQNEQLNLISSSLLQTISLLSSMIFLTGINIWILSIFCMNIWRGKLYFCSGLGSYDGIINKTDCVNAGGQWINNVANYDTIQDSILCIFRLIIGEGWVSLMFSVSDITGRDQNPRVDASAYFQVVYYILLFLLNIMLLNLFTGLIINNYRTVKENISNYKSLNENQREWLQMMSIMQKKNLIRLIVKPSNQFRQICYYISTQKYFELVVLVLLLLNLILYVLLILSCSSYSSNRNETTKSVFFVLDILFIVLFHVEVCIKFAAFGYYYLKESWNKFDIILLIATDAILIVQSEVSMPKMFMIPLLLRSLRVLNNYKVLKLNRQLRVLVDVIQDVLPTLLSFVAFLLITVIIYALIGVQVFSTVKSSSDDAQYPLYSELDQRYYNFSNFWDSMIILMEITTGQYWPVYLTDYSNDKVGCHAQTYLEAQEQGPQGCGTLFAYIYFISFLVLIRIIMFSLFLAMIIEQYQECLMENTAVINPYQIEDFFLKWSDYDPQGTGWISPEDFAFLMFEMNPPLGFKDENAQLQLYDFNPNHKKQSAYIYNPRTKMHLKKIDIFKKLSDFQVLIYQNQMIHIKDVCIQIAYNAVKKKNDLAGIEQIEDKVVLRKIRKSWEARYPDLADKKCLHFAVDIFAISSISNILRGVIERRKVKKRIKEMQKQNNLRQLEINENAYLTSKNAEDAHRHRRKSQIRKRVFPFAQSNNSYRKSKNIDSSTLNRRVVRKADQMQQSSFASVDKNSLNTHNFYIDPAEMYNGFPMKVAYETQKIDFPSDNSQRSLNGKVQLGGDISERGSEEESRVE